MVKLDLAKENMKPEELITEFDPTNDNYDKRILYEITGRKIDEADYLDDSDQENNSASVLYTRD